MEAGKPIWKDPRYVYPAAAVVVALFVILPFLGSFGFWEPQEITVADEARKVAKDGGWSEAGKTHPPLTTWLIATSIRIFGVNELAARLPLALFGILGIVATMCLAWRVASARAGLFAAVVLVSSPLFLFQSRQLTSDVVSATCAVAAVLGLVGLCWPRGGTYRVPWLVGDAALALIALILGFFASGLVLGVIVPVAGVGIAAAVAVVGRYADAEEASGDAGDRRALRLQHTIFAAACGAVVVALLVVVFMAVFDWETAKAGQWQIGGETLVADKKYVALLGGTWRPGDPPAAATFDWVIDQLAFGMFPWSAIAPIALLRLAWPGNGAGRRDRGSFGAVAILAWTAAAYLISALFVRKVGELRFAAVAGVAVAVGMYLDDLLRQKAEDRPTPGMPLAALFILAATLQLARDIVAFPDELASVHVLKSIKHPAEMKPWLRGIAVIGFLVAAACLVATAMRGAGPGEERRRWVARGAIWGTGGLALILGVYVSFVYTPKLSQHFSYRNLFESYFDHRTGSEPLGVMGIAGSGPEYYARGPFERLASLAQLNEFLKKDTRVFAITPADKLCAVHQAAGQNGFSYHVLDNRNSRFLLLTNRLAGKEKDENPLMRAFQKTPPDKVARPVNANFEEKIELIGVDMPDAVEHGDKFKMTLWFKVLERPTTNYKILLHFDGIGARFQGDHEPIEGRCGTTYWQPGDYVRDEVWVTAGEMTNPRGTYEVYTGFFTGGGGQWKNMNVVSGPKGADNRVPLGKIRVR